MGEHRRDRNWSMQVTALYDYEPEESDELGFWEGDVLRVLRVQDDGWWSGYKVKRPDVVGLFPSNYVQAQRSAPLQQTAKVVADAVTTPRPPDSSRQRIQLQPRKAPDTPELDDEDENDDKLQELPAEYRGHIGTVLQLRKSLEEAERASEVARDARRQAERERLRHRKSWRGREQDEAEDEDVDHGQQESRSLQLAQAYHQQLEGHSEDEEDNEDDEELAYPQRQGYMHENHQEEEPQEGESEKGHNSEEDNDEQTEGGQSQAAETAAIENAAATLLAKAYRRHCALVQRNHEREREVEQEKLSSIAAVCIQRWASHAFSRQCERRRRNLEQNTARRRWEREHEAAAEIQKWVRMRWACFWLQAEREKQAARESQQAFQREELKEAEHRQAELVEEQRQKAEAEKLVAVDQARRRLQQQAEVEQEEEQRRLLDQKREQEERRELQLKAVEEEVHVQFLQAHEEDGNHPAVPSESSHANSPDKPRRKVMKKEAVELIKTLVQQQLGETLRDHDAKMDELQRMVARLQTVVRKQTAMLEDSTDQIVNLQMGRQEQRLPVPPRDNDTSSASFLPKIGSQSSIPRQPVAPSGLRVPRPVVMSKLPILASSGRIASRNQSRKAS